MQKLKHLEPYKGLKKFTINDNKNLNSLKLMRMRKILFNKKELNSQEIKEMRDFDLVLKKVQAQRDFWKSPWFFGTIGLASILSFLFFI